MTLPLRLAVNGRHGKYDPEAKKAARDAKKAESQGVKPDAKYQKEGPAEQPPKRNPQGNQSKDSGKNSSRNNASSQLHS